MLKNLRNITETKISSATMPTKKAAISSMPSMKRSITLRGRAARGAASAASKGSAPATGWLPNGGAEIPAATRLSPPTGGGGKFVSVAGIVFDEIRLEFLED